MKQDGKSIKLTVGNNISTILRAYYIDYDHRCRAAGTLSLNKPSINKTTINNAVLGI